MIIDFTKLEEQHMPQFKGGEGEYIMRQQDDGSAKIMLGKLAPGSTIGYHTHETNSEIIYIISGTGSVLYDDGEETVHAGQCHYCPKGHAHSLRNQSDEDLVFFATVPEQ